MDHLPLPRNAGPPIAVPRLDVIPYDFVPCLPLNTALDHFRLFPDRHGFGSEGILHPDLEPDELARVVQSWLYFGLISAFFDTHIEIMDFTITVAPCGLLQKPGVARVTSAPLNTLLRRLDREDRESCDKEQVLYVAEQTETDHNRKRFFQEHREVLKASRELRRELRKDMCSHAFNSVRRLHKSDVARSIELAAICLSIQLLAVTLLGCNPTREPELMEVDLRHMFRSKLPIWKRFPFEIFEIFEIFLKNRDKLDDKLKTRETREDDSINWPEHSISYPNRYFEDSHWEGNLLRSTMVRNGWCQSELDDIFANQDLLTVYYLAQIERSQVFSLPHNQCTKDACVAINSPSHPPYRRSHTIDACQCREIFVNTEALCRIIEDGDIPLVYLEPTAHGTFRLRLKRMGSLSSYVAISHVWSDGLGNPSGNSLFQCEIESLRDSLHHIPIKRYIKLRTICRLFRLIPGCLASKLFRRGKPDFRKQLFWMDTLCIPVAKSTDPPTRVARINALKSQAIHRMNMVYYGATHVLILDGELRRINLKEAPRCEVAARIAYGRWNARCWTLQEGALGSAWLLRFSDGILGCPRAGTFWQQLQDPTDAQGRRGRNHVLKYLEELETLFGVSESSGPMPSTAVSVEQHIRRRLVQVLEAPMQVFSNSDGIYQREEREDEDKRLRRDLSSFSSIWDMLARRTTSEEVDVPIIFANLLDFNLHQLVQKFPNERMLMGILWNLKAIPLALLFNRGSRLDGHKKHRNRWVPTKLQAIRCGTASMKWEDAGLRFINSSGNSSLILFKWPRHVASDRILVQTPKGGLYVNILRQENDEMAMEMGSQYAIVADGSCVNITGEPREHYKTVIRGALLHVHEYIGADQGDGSEQDRECPRFRPRISAVYDCPVDVSFNDEQQTFDGAPVVDTAELWNHEEEWEVFLQIDSNNARLPPLTRRIDSAESHFFFLVASVILVALNYVAIGTRIAIAARLGWSTLQPLGRAALVLWVIENLNTPLLFPTKASAPFVVRALFAVDRSRNGGLTALDWAYLANPYSSWLSGVFWAVAIVVDDHVGWYLNMRFYSDTFTNPKGVKDRFIRFTILLFMSLPWIKVPWYIENILEWINLVF
ncbi:hypothetical protein F4860DRAFT_498347 [Xylaria cubensis]|nr:hypothetical protein F4860DRAFT_498347 [Xylaria cubensis]